MIEKKRFFTGRSGTQTLAGSGLRAVVRARSIERPLRWIPAGCVLGLVIFLLGGAEPGAGEEIELQFLNGAYTDLDSDLEPVREGPLVIRFSSPDHEVRVNGNRVVLTPVAADILYATLEVDFEGEGHLVADIEGLGVNSRYTDEVAAPRQTVRVAGKIRLMRVVGGYLVTVEEAPPAVNLEIRSALAQRIVKLCRTLAKIPFVRLNCSGLETSLSVVTVPLPQPGEQFLVPEEDLTEEERAFFDRFTAAGEPSPAAPRDHGSGPGAFNRDTGAPILYTWPLTGSHEGMPKPGAALRPPKQRENSGLETLPFERGERPSGSGLWCVRDKPRGPGLRRSTAPERIRES